MSAEEWCVYKHTSPSGKVYIGITHQKPEKRWLGGHGYEKNHHFWSAISKYGWENFNHEVLVTGLTQDQAEQIEKELVAAYDSANREKGYNIAEGGHALSEESRKKIGDTRRARGIKPHNTGKHLSEETKKKISTANKGNRYHTVWTEEQIERVRKSKLGKNNPNYGKPMDEAKKRMLIAMHEKPVIQLKDGTEIVYRSAREAGDMTGIANSNITRVCRGQRGTAGGYVWRYA